MEPKKTRRAKHMVKPDIETRHLDQKFRKLRISSRH